MTTNLREVFWWWEKQALEKELLQKKKKKKTSNKLFVKLKKGEWLSQIDLSKFGEAKIQPGLSAPVEFYYP